MKSESPSISFMLRRSLIGKTTAPPGGSTSGEAGFCLSKVFSNCPSSFSVSLTSLRSATRRINIKLEPFLLHKVPGLIEGVAVWSWFSACAFQNRGCNGASLSVHTQIIHFSGRSNCVKFPERRRWNFILRRVHTIFI